MKSISYVNKNNFHIANLELSEKVLLINGNSHFFSLFLVAVNVDSKDT